MASKKRKVDYASFKISQFNFRDEKDYSNLFMLLLGRLSGVGFGLPPFKPGKYNDVQVLGSVLGFNKEPYKSLLIYHSHRQKKERKIFIALIYTIALSICLPVIVILITSIGTFTLTLLALISTVILLFEYITVGIAFRLSRLVTLRYFSDSISIQTSLYIVTELARCHTLLTPFQKKKLLGLVSYLRKSTQSIKYQYNNNAEISEWATKHFQQIDFFIHEREKWIIASKSSTLNKLQQDFYYLAQILICGNFGDFEYYSESEPIKGKTSDKIRNFIAGIPRFIFGILLPISGLITISIYPDILKNIIDVRVFTLICIGWLLLAIDVVLKLGIISSVISVAKGIKDLS